MKLILVQYKCIVYNVHYLNVWILVKHIPYIRPTFYKPWIYAILRTLITFLVLWGNEAKFYGKFNQPEIRQVYTVAMQNIIGHECCWTISYTRAHGINCFCSKLLVHRFMKTTATIALCIVLFTSHLCSFTATLWIKWNGYGW